MDWITTKDHPKVPCSFKCLISGVSSPIKPSCCTDRHTRALPPKTSECRPLLMLASETENALRSTDRETRERFRPRSFAPGRRDFSPSLAGFQCLGPLSPLFSARPALCPPLIEKRQRGCIGARGGPRKRGRQRVSSPFAQERRRSRFDRIGFDRDASPDNGISS